jgi:hypothetical protein
VLLTYPNKCLFVTRARVCFLVLVSCSTLIFKVFYVSVDYHFSSIKKDNFDDISYYMHLLLLIKWFW